MKLFRCDVAPRCETTSTRHKNGMESRAMETIRGIHIFDAQCLIISIWVPMEQNHLREAARGRLLCTCESIIEHAPHALNYSKFANTVRFEWRGRSKENMCSNLFSCNSTRLLSETNSVTRSCQFPCRAMPSHSHWSKSIEVIGASRLINCIGHRPALQTITITIIINVMKVHPVESAECATCGRALLVIDSTLDSCNRRMDGSM